MNVSYRGMLPDSLTKMVTEYIQGSAGRIILYQELSSLRNMCDVTHKIQCISYSMIQLKGKLYMISPTSVVPIQKGSGWHRIFTDSGLFMQISEDGIVKTLNFQT